MHYNYWWAEVPGKKRLIKVKTFEGQRYSCNNLNADKSGTKNDPDYLILCRSSYFITENKSHT